MPILNEQGCCIGLIDAESWTPGFFVDHRVAVVAKCAMDVAAELERVPCEERARKKRRFEAPQTSGKHWFVNGRVQCLAA